MNEDLILANIVQAVSGVLAKTANTSTETTVRASARRAGQVIALEESIGIELKNKLTPGAK